MKMEKAYTKRGSVRFTVETADGIPQIKIESDKDLELPILYFELRPETSLEEAEEIGTFLNHNIDALACTFCEKEKTLKELIDGAESDGELDARAIIRHHEFELFKQEFHKMFRLEEEGNIAVSAYWLCQKYMSRSRRSVLDLKDIEIRNYAVGWYKGFRDESLIHFCQQTAIAASAL
jgi:hypothetical protein